MCNIWYWALRMKLTCIFFNTDLPFYLFIRYSVFRWLNHKFMFPMAMMVVESKLEFELDDSSNYERFMINFCLENTGVILPLKAISFLGTLLILGSFIPYARIRKPIMNSRLLMIDYLFWLVSYTCTPTQWVSNLLFRTSSSVPLLWEEKVVSFI